MAEEIRVRIIPGCPSRVIAETEEDRKLAEEALANIDCGCVVEVEGAAKAARAEAEEAEAAEETEHSEGEGETLKLQEESVVEPVTLVCSLEPDKPWDESVCGVVAKEAGRQAAEKVLARLREEGLVK